MDRHRRRWGLLALGALALAGVVAAVLVVSTRGGPEQAVASDLPRAAPSAPEADVRALVAGDLALGTDMLRATGTRDAVVSPLSAGQALRMLRAGAAGETAAGIDRAMGVDLPGPRTFAAANVLGQSLAATRGVTLDQANAVWLQRGMPVERPFLDILARDFGTGARLSDFQGDPDGATREVNDWVSEQTDGAIPTLFERLGPDTRLALVNAVRFRGRWQAPFDAGLTKERPFTRADGTVTQVPTMFDARMERYAERGGVQVLALPYEGDQVEMLVLLPARGGLPALERALDEAWLRGAAGALAMRQVEIFLPRLDLEARLDLTPVLGSRGMGVAFSPGADFTPVTRAEPLQVSAAVQRAVLRMNETETEAAAATGITARVTAAPPEDPVRFRADRPFLIVMRHRPTGAVLFLGRMAGLP
ncbi:MAG: serpin family protein [Thermoleophilia bacterium]|jgi:serpin B|nr:serpin family protein [Thermoleophilia bacterium]